MTSGRRKFKFPEPPAQLKALIEAAPIINAIDPQIEKIVDRLATTRFVKGAQSLVELTPVIEPITIPTPFGTIHTSPISLPDFVPPSLDERQRAAVRAGVGATVGELVGFLPGIGDVLGGIISDHYKPLIRSTLTEQELLRYQTRDKLWPTVVAVLWALAEERKERNPVQKAVAKVQAVGAVGRLMARSRRREAH